MIFNKSDTYIAQLLLLLGSAFRESIEKKCETKVIK